jgi:hypothetical protein
MAGMHFAGFEAETRLKGKLKTCNDAADLGHLAQCCLVIHDLSVCYSYVDVPIRFECKQPDKKRKLLGPIV